ncbi:dihydrodipicolinate reductase [Rhodobacteraceae bacterium SC52]|nr:dihydrodipicolinate reductase [Rhodobacteraceae bacterium SC52]
MPKRHITAALAVAATFVAAPALADYEKITDRSEFLDVVSNTTLTRLGIKVQVTPDGGIRGSAFGSPVTGTWSWDSGYFCRDLAWGGDDLGYNCQEVARDGGSIRFTSDKGSGRSASLKLD